jgi:ketosteroid isomerase-like protein
MGEDGVDVVRELFEAWNRGDRDAVLELAHPEIVIDASRRVINPATYEGVEGVRRMLDDMVEVWDDFRAETDEFIDAGDGRLIVIGRILGTGRGSGVAVEQPMAGIWTVRDGLIVRWELGFVHKRAALEAAGLAAPEDDP